MHDGLLLLSLMGGVTVAVAPWVDQACCCSSASTVRCDYDTTGSRLWLSHTIRTTTVVSYTTVAVKLQWHRTHDPIL